MANFAPGQIFDPLTFSPEQAALLQSEPGKSLSATNTPEMIRAAQELPTNIPADTIRPVNPLTLPSGTPTIDYNPIFASTRVSLPPPPKSSEELAVDKNQQDILMKMKELGGEDTFQAQQEESAGVVTNRRELVNLQAQLTAVNNEAVVSQLDVERQGRPTVLTAAATLEKGNIERDRTIKALRLSSSIQAIQGNLALANDQVERAVKLKYDPLRSEIDILNKQLDLNYKTFDRAEKKKADELKLQNDEKKRLLNLEEHKESSWELNKNTALSNGAPVALVRQADASRTTGDENTARALLAPYTGAIGRETLKSTFTTSQINTGATTSGIPIADFKLLDTDSQNYFINNKKGFEKQKKVIDEAKTAGEDPTVIKEEITTGDLPPVVQDALTKYLWSVFPRSTTGSKAWWQFWK